MFILSLTFSVAGIDSSEIEQIETGVAALVWKAPAASGYDPSRNVREFTWLYENFFGGVAARKRLARHLGAPDLRATLREQ